MAVWYEVEKTKKGIWNFLESNACFHDYRHERIEYVPGKDMVEIFLKYDNGTEGVLLRFSGIAGVGINTRRDYDAEWLGGSTAFVLGNGNLIWLDDDGWGEDSPEHLEEMKEYTTWVEAERVYWAVTDAEGCPVEMPADRIDAVLHISDYDAAKGRSVERTEERHYDLKEFTGKWDEILLPYYMRRI